MEIDLRDNVRASEYHELLKLYKKQMTKTAELQAENTALYNLTCELRETVDKLKRVGKKGV